MGQSIASAKPRRGFKEFVRKFFVTLKRNPHNIALFMMLITFVFYSLNMTYISFTSIYANKQNMGQCQFVAMLLGILALVSFLRAFPRREKPSIAMIAITVVMLIASTAAEFLYATRINQYLNDTANPPQGMRDDAGELTERGKNIYTAQAVVSTHIILLIVCIGLIILLPVYSKLIKKINTSIDVAGNENMAAIDMAEDE